MFKNMELENIEDNVLFKDSIKFEYIESVIGSGYENKVADLAIRDNQGYRVVSPRIYSLDAKSRLQYIYKEMIGEFSERLILLLKKHGIKARINDHGHISVDIQSLPVVYAKVLS